MSNFKLDKKKSLTLVSFSLIVSLCEDAACPSQWPLIDSHFSYQIASIAFIKIERAEITSLIQWIGVLSKYERNYNEKANQDSRSKSKRCFNFVQLAVNSDIFILNFYYIFGLEVKINYPN